MTSPHGSRPGQEDREIPVPGQTSYGSAGPGGRTPGPPAGPGRRPPQTPPPGASGETVGYATISGPERAWLGSLDGLDLARSAWPAFFAAGLGCLALGVILLAWPKATLAVVAILIGASLIVVGLLRLISGFTSRDARGAARAGSVVIGLLAMVVGLYSIRHYHVTIAVLAIVVGLYWMLHGIAEIAAGLVGGRGLGRAITMLAGVLSLVAGVLVLFWPTISLTVLVAVMGIWLIVYGILMMTAASMLRRSDATADQAGLGQKLARRRLTAGTGYDASERTLAGRQGERHGACGARPRACGSWLARKGGAA